MVYNFANDIMKKENNEIQSRREFFKKAAKGALPILGAVILASSPIISKAVEKEPMGCEYGCAGGCYTNCYGSCKRTCNYYCTTGCLTSCGAACDGGCAGSCTGSCVGNCYTSCDSSCSGVAY